jgi:ATP-binding cassette subfamily C protein
MKTILKSQRSSETTQNSRDLISIQKITYTHRKSKHSEVISELSLSINLGDKVALVGSSGSGKSTLLDIISNLLAPSKGKIYYNWPSNGIGQYHSQEDILPGVNQHKIFHLHQKPCIINKTIRENILFPYEEDAFNSCAYQKACDVVELNTMLKQCGYTENQVLGDNGSGLSGGQLQRIGLARALYHNPILLLLDESTSALDIISETLILSRILKYYPKTTLVFVTHRVNSLKEFNKIHVLNQGSIISSGTYSELIKTCPLFSNLSKSGL